MHGKILWLHDGDLSSGQKFSFEQLLGKGKNNVDRDRVMYVNLKLRVPGIWQRKVGTKATWQRVAEKEKAVHEYLQGIVKRENIKVIVIQDKVALNFITETQSSLNLCRGSVYYYKGVTPAIVLDEPYMIHAQREGTWIFVNDINKIQRWYHGQQRFEPRFDYTVCRTAADIGDCLEFSRDAFAASVDIETFNKYISCVGYSFISNTGVIRSFVIPLINPLKPNACHWDNPDDEVAAWKTIAEINGNPDLFKVLQNGPYDASYFTIYHCPLVNYFGDTAIAFHSIWTEAKKKLNFISSTLLDYYRFWKDEMKGDKKDEKKSESIPRDARGLERYWRYNALDCYNTLLNWRLLCALLLAPQFSWCLQNYVRLFSAAVGPTFAMSMRGMATSRMAMVQKGEAELVRYHAALAEFQTMCADPNVNPNSNEQIASLLYDVLGATPIKKRGAKGKGGRSVDERVLKLVADQHPMFRCFIEKLWEVRKPLAAANKYGNMHLINNRFLYSLGVTRTGTERLGSGQHAFHVGTNAQNIPKEWRDIFHADEGYVLVELDYSQSDAWFIAYQAQEMKMIEVMNDPRDTHCVHAEHFFGRPYSEIYAAHQIEADWTDHPTKGVRQNTKRIVHGSNFRMEAYTLYTTMGHEAVVAAGLAVGKVGAAGWKIKEAVNFCGEMLDAYHLLYPRLRNADDNWFAEVVKECIENGNIATNCHGFSHRFFGNIEKDKAIQRELTAFYGQSGTAGNVNNAMSDCYYKHNLDDGVRAMMLLQVHDSLLWQVRIDCLDLIKEIKQVMERKVTIHGREFVVPVDCKIGWHWGKGMVSWYEGITIDEIMATRDKWQKKYSFANLEAAE